MTSSLNVIESDELYASFSGLLTQRATKTTRTWLRQNGLFWGFQVEILD